MAYAPINIPAYVAAFSGAVAGMAVSGWIVDPVSADYALVTQIAGAFAQEFDIVWNSAAQLNNLENASIVEIVAREFANRGPGPLANSAFTTPSNWAKPAAACAALVLQSDAYFASQGINPGTGGAGGSTVKVNGADTTAGFLASKLVVDGTLSLTILNPGANEQIQLGLFVAFAITGFGLTGASLLLAGASDVSPGFAASYNQLATAVSLTDTEGNNDVIALPGTAFVSPHTFTKNVYGQSVTFTVHASNANGAATAAAAVSWGQNVFFGSAVDPGGGGYNTAFLNSLGSTLKLAPNGNYNYNASALQSCFWAARSGFGLTPANFTVGGFPFACSKVATFAYTNANGVIENYDLFRSDNIGLGAFTLVEA
jgi:hypothetical protein